LSFYLSGRLTEVDRSKFKVWVWLVTVGGDIAIVGAMAINAITFHSVVPIVLALTYQLAIAAMLFIRYVVMDLAD
jgi:hypothetical protein